MLRCAKKMLLQASVCHVRQVDFYKENIVIHKETIAHIARRLPHQQQHNVREVIDLLMEVWSDELIQGNEVIVPTIGKLSIEVQDIQAGGALISQGHLQRVYGRFRPTPTFKRKIKEAQFE
jgi:nucleoid DNA-binding protein